MTALVQCAQGALVSDVSSTSRVAGETSALAPEPRPEELRVVELLIGEMHTGL